MISSLFYGLGARRGYRFLLVVISCNAVLSYSASDNVRGALRQEAAKAAPVTPTEKEHNPAALARSQSGDTPRFPPEQIQAGKALFAGQCSFCHGRDAEGGESGPDLMASALVEQDVRGEKIGVVVRNGRPGKAMPAFQQTDEQLAGLVAFIHDQKTKAKEGRRRTVDVADLQSGNVEAGMRYFNGAGGCSKCHSPSGDFAGIASKLQGLELLRRMLYRGEKLATESGEEGGSKVGAPPVTPTATVTLSSGQSVTGKLAYRDEFTIALVDDGGWFRSWPASQVKYTVRNPLEGHIELLGKYTDEEIHDVLAYLQTLR